MKRIFTALFLTTSCLLKAQTPQESRPALVPMAATETLQYLEVPQGLALTLVAGEPGIVQPKGIAFDEMGRMWVLQDVTYLGRHVKLGETLPPHEHALSGTKSAVVIFTDTKRNGTWDKRDIFLEMEEVPAGIAVGGGNVFVGIGSHIVRFPIKPGGTTPAGPGEVIVGGFKDSGAQGYNGFIWGPDGWLYGGQGCGGRSYQKLVKPAVPWATGMAKVFPPTQKSNGGILGSAGVFRVNPDGSAFEWFCEGTSNVWGLDFDAFGEPHSVTTVSDGPWHWIQGGRFDRQDGIKMAHNPFTYETMPSTRVDARHTDEMEKLVERGGKPPGVPPNWKRWNMSRPMGGAFMFGDLWPEPFRNQFAITGLWQGAMMTHTKYQGSASVAWWEGVSLIKPFGPKVGNPPKAKPPTNIGTLIYKNVQGPDGAIYFIDWAETSADMHSGFFKRDGRIYRLAPEGAKQVPAFDLNAETDAQLVERSITGEEWFSRMARVTLAGRARAGKLDPGTVGAVKARFESGKQTREQLRALWSLRACNAATDEMLTPLSKHPDERVRSWAIQLGCEDNMVTPGFLAEMVRLAKTETSPVVRRYLGSAVGRIPIEQTKQVLLPLMSMEADGNDTYLPLLYWYAVERVISSDTAFASTALAATKHPKIRELIARRLVDPGPPEKK